MFRRKNRNKREVAAPMSSDKGEEIHISRWNLGKRGAIMGSKATGMVKDGFKERSVAEQNPNLYNQKTKEPRSYVDDGPVVSGARGIYVPGEGEGYNVTKENPFVVFVDGKSMRDVSREDPHESELRTAIENRKFNMNGRRKRSRRGSRKRRSRSGSRKRRGSRKRSRRGSRKRRSRCGGRGRVADGSRCKRKPGPKRRSRSRRLRLSR